MCGKGSEISWAGEPGKTALLEALGAKLQAHYKGCKKKNSLPVAKNRVFCSCGDFFAFLFVWVLVMCFNLVFIIMYLGQVLCELRRHDGSCVLPRLNSHIGVPPSVAKHPLLQPL